MATRLQRRDRLPEKLERTLQMMDHVEGNDVSGLVPAERQGHRVGDQVGSGAYQYVGSDQFRIERLEVARTAADLDGGPMLGQRRDALRIPVGIDRAQHRFARPY